MNNTSHYLKALALAAIAAGALHSSANAQGTAFTYQGKLDVGGTPANGLYDFQFNLHSAASGGSALTGAVSVNALPVTNGLFTATLDFGNQFPGAARWLAMSVRTNGPSAFNALDPRQPITATPYAITAGNVTGSVPASQLTGTIAAGRLPANVVTNLASGVSLTGTFSGTLTGNGAALTSLPAGQLTGSIADARLSSNVALRNGGNTFNGNQIVASGSVGIGIASPAAKLHVNGDFLRVEGAGGQAAYLGADIANSDIELGSLNPSVQLVSLWNAGAGTLMSLSAQDLSLGGTLNGQPVGNFALRNGGNNFVGNQSLAGGSLSFLDANVSLTYPPVGGPSSAMIHMFAGGTGNADRMVLAHSPAFTSYGLQYRDSVDAFNFLGGGSPVFSVGLVSHRVGVGTDNPQARLHIYGSENPATIRLQSSAGPGFGRLEFFSDPLGAPNEWRLGYIQSIDHGGFTGGMRFVSNIPGEKFGEIEAMRVVAGRVGIGTGATTPVNKLQVQADNTGGDAINAVCNTFYTAVYGQNTSGAGFGVTGVATGSGIAINGANPDAAGHAGYFTGNVRVTGTTTTGILTITGGADLAEPFKMSAQDLPKGSVVVIDEANPGHLKLSEGAYDTRVAGIISGAGGVNPGISLSQHGVMEGDQNVALSGRVYVQADASTGAIKPGDLLTTSAIPGHAMKVSDATRSQGAILGKAMTSLKDGQGLVLVLVTLQ